LRTIFFSGDKRPEEPIRDANKFKIRNSAYPDIDNRVVALLNDAVPDVSGKFRSKALEYVVKFNITTTPFLDWCKFTHFLHQILLFNQPKILPIRIV